MFPKISRNIWMAGLLTCLMTSVASAQKIDWKQDLNSAKQQAAQEGKLVLLHFYADWCAPCQQLDTFVFNHETVARNFKENMVAVKVDIDVHPDLVSEYNVKSIPFEVAITPNGNLVHRQKSPTTSDNYITMLQRLGGMKNRIAKADQSIINDSRAFQDRLKAKQAGTSLDSKDSMQFNSTNVDFKPAAQNAQSFSNDSGQFQPRNSAMVKNEFASAPKAQPKSNTIDFVNNQHMAQANQKPNPQAFRATTHQQSDDQSFQPRTVQAKPVTQPQRIVNQMGSNSATGANSNSTNSNFAANSFQTRPSDTRAKIRTEPQEQAKPQQLAMNATNDSKPNPTPKTSSSFALNGNCPVSLLSISKWVPGNKKFGCVHRGKTYLFASKEHMETFLSDPDRYSPVLAGFDPVAFTEQGEFNDGKESLGVFMSKGGQQKIVLFESMANRTKFQQDPKRYLEAVRVATERIDQGTTIRR